MNQELIDVLQQHGERPAFDFGRLKAQEDFLTDPHRFKMLSGSFATGKTTALCAHVIMLMLIPGNMGYLGRLDGKSLRQSTLVTLLEMLPKEAYTKNDQQGFIKLKKEYGGSILVYGDFKDENDLKNLPLGFFAIDQAEEVDEHIWKLLSGRLRRRVPVLTLEGRRQYKVLGECSAALSKGSDHRHYAQYGESRCESCRKRLPTFTEERHKIANGSRVRVWDLISYKRHGLGACNPEGPSHWIFKMFPGLPGKDSKKDNAPIHISRGTDIPKLRDRVKGYHSDIYEALDAGFIDEEYVEDLEAQYADRPEMHSRYMLGHWIDAEGRVYPAFDKGVHVISRTAMHYSGENRVLISPSAPVYEYIDHGTTSPTAVGWVAVEDCDCGCQRQNFYVIAEHYESNKPVSYHASIMKNVRTQLYHAIMVTYLDSQAFAKTYSKKVISDQEDRLYAIADEYADNDIFCVPNQKDRETGYNRISELLQVDENHIHPVTGESGGSASTCIQSLRQYDL